MSNNPPRRAPLHGRLGMRQSARHVARPQQHTPVGAIASATRILHAARPPLQLRAAAPPSPQPPTLLQRLCHALSCRSMSSAESPSSASSSTRSIMSRLSGGGEFAQTNSAVSPLARLQIAAAAGVSMGPAGGGGGGGGGGGSSAAMDPRERDLWRHDSGYGGEQVPSLRLQHEPHRPLSIVTEESNGSLTSRSGMASVAFSAQTSARHLPTAVHGAGGESMEATPRVLHAQHSAREAAREAVARAAVSGLALSPGGGLGRTGAGVPLAVSRGGGGGSGGSSGGAASSTSANEGSSASEAALHTGGSLAAHHRVRASSGSDEWDAAAEAAQAAGSSHRPGLILEDRDSRELPVGSPLAAGGHARVPPLALRRAGAPPMGRLDAALSAAKPVSET